jgi:hypothetical protein
MKKFNMYARRKSLAWSTAAACALMLSACGGGGDNASNANGTLGVSLTDAPACGFDAVNVTVAKVRVNQSSTASDTDGGWTDITVNRKINLLNLNNGLLDNLGEMPLTPGHYTQLRLVLDANTKTDLTNSVVPTGGVETALVTPSAVQSGIKLVNAFDVAAGQRVDLVLDFNACKSIVKRGNGVYALKPVIQVVPFALNGIDGFVDKSMLGNEVLVTAQQGGVVVQTTAPNATTGEFFLTRLPIGNYDVVMTANGRSTAVVGAVPVTTTTSVTVLSSSLAPITLPTSLVNRTVSGTAVLNPANALVDTYVAAKQTFGTAPTVTVKSVMADDLAAGAYSMTLPASPPVFSAYAIGWASTSLVAQATLAAKYNVEASALGYTTQVSAKDITTLDATQAFTLIP